MRRLLRVLLLLACAVAAAADGDEGAGEAGGASGDATAGDAGTRALHAATTPEWLAARSQRRWVINGDTWHRVVANAADASQSDVVYYYNERTRATAWELPRHAPRGTPLWATRAADGSERRLGPPLFDLSALSFPDCAADWATIALPAALFVAAKHAGPAGRALRQLVMRRRGAACDAMRDAAAACGVRCASGAAPKAD